MEKRVTKPERMVALLRAINVGGSRKVPMAALSELAAGIGLSEVATYIQSGNLVFTSKLDAARAESLLERALLERFGFEVPTVVRTGAEVSAYAAACPFPDAATERPNLLHIGLSKRPPRPDAGEVLLPKANAGERIAVRGGALWIDYPAGAGRSKVTPAAIDKAVGSATTSRNFRTLLKLCEMLGVDG